MVNEPFTILHFLNLPGDLPRGSTEQGLQPMALSLWQQPVGYSSGALLFV
jgi:hypothetical protein